MDYIIKVSLIELGFLRHWWKIAETIKPNYKIADYESVIKELIEIMDNFDSKARVSLIPNREYIFAVHELGWYEPIDNLPKLLDEFNPFVTRAIHKVFEKHRVYGPTTNHDLMTKYYIKIMYNSLDCAIRYVKEYRKINRIIDTKKFNKLIDQITMYDDLDNKYTNSQIIEQIILLSEAPLLCRSTPSVRSTRIPSESSA